MLLIRSFVLILALHLVSMALARADEASSDSGQATIQIKPINEVDGTNSEITFGDLIVAHGLSDALLSDIRQIHLADMPKAGESRTFTALAIEEVFRPQLRSIEAQIGEKVALRVPPRVTVTRKVFRLKSEDVSADMNKQLKLLCVDCRFEVTDLKIPTLQNSLSSAAVWNLRMNTELPKGNFSLPLEVKNEDGSKRTYWVTGNLRTYRTVIVAKRSLNSGDKIRTEDYTQEEKDITFASDNSATVADIEGSVVAKPMAAGQIIWRAGLRREVAVKVGESVKVVSGGDSWLITIDGVAQNAGYIGDTVNVKIPRTQKMLSGLLKEKGVVEVH